jgi:hypothetical protein
MKALLKMETRMPSQTFIVISTPTTRKDLVQTAVEQVSKIGQVFEQHYPPLFSEWYECPAVKMPSGRIIFGMDGILMFVERGGKESSAEHQRAQSHVKMG